MSELKGRFTECSDAMPMSDDNDFLQVFIRGSIVLNGDHVSEHSTVCLHIHKDCTVGQLYDHVTNETDLHHHVSSSRTRSSEVTGASTVARVKHRNDWRLTFAGQELDCDDYDSVLEDYDVTDMATFDFQLGLNGGSSDPRIQYMSMQPVKTIGKVAGCPSMRGCPKCGQVLEHSDACKHMKCFACCCEFCFVCLKLKLDGTPGWQCGTHSDVCPVAPLQTDLPNKFT